jgi:uncharacterized protein YndB with AHSA1/START domain
MTDELPITIEPGPTLRLERTVPQPIERVWRALTDPDDLTHWFPGEMEIVEADEPHRLVATWHGDTLEFQLTPAGDGCRLVFTHAFDDRDTAARSAAGWHVCFIRFDRLLAGDPLGERESLAEWPDVHERYAEAYGVDPEIGRRAYAEHPLT